MNQEDIKKFLFNSMSNILKVQDFLDSHPGFDPRQYHNEQNNNILHHLSFYDHRDLLQLYIRHTARLIEDKIQNSKGVYKKQVKQQIASWVNQKNVEGFTPLLYAAFNGHIQLIKDLQGIGARYDILNKTQLNALHMAAQNNKVSTFIYFQGKIDINAPDQKGNTPLHWAAYSGSEEVVSYLMAIDGVKINPQDSMRNTPLMLATAYGNTKIVRRLLIKGASRRIRNTKDQLPIAVARQKQFPNITRMLDDDYSCCDFFKFYYNVKLQYKPKKRKMTIPIVFLVTTFCALMILHTLIQYKHDATYIVQGVIIIPMLILYLSLLWPPKKQPQGEYMQFINQTRKMCFQCVRKKPKRSYHCDICNTCIQQYDHHCTWINNCVGKKNLARFIIFVFLLTLSLAYIGIICICNFINLVSSLKILNQWIDLRHSYIQNQQLKKYIRLLLLTINIVISCFFFPVLLLFCVQLKNLLVNKTTYERIRTGNSSVKQQLKGKKKSGMSMKNCKTMCAKTRQSFISQDSFQDQLLSHTQD